MSSRTGFFAVPSFDLVEVHHSCLMYNTESDVEQAMWVHLPKACQRETFAPFLAGNSGRPWACTACVRQLGRAHKTHNTVHPS